MEFPEVDFARLVDRMNRTIAVSGVQEGTAYLHITRGVAPRAHAFPDPTAVPPTELIAIRPYDDTQAAQNRINGVGTLSHPELRWKRCDVKSTNLLANVMAHEAAHGPAASRPSWSARTDSSPRPRTARSSGSATAGSKERPKTMGSSRARRASSSSRQPPKPVSPSPKRG